MKKQKNHFFFICLRSTEVDSLNLKSDQSENKHICDDYFKLC